MNEAPRRGLLAANADAYARVAMSNVRREYPTHVSYWIGGPGSLASPRELHPAFYGSFDWHSCVEMHWVLVRLLRTMPGLPAEREMRAALDANLTEGALVTEAAYVAGHPTFERPYGWGWALALANELAGWGDADGARWLAHLRPLAAAIRDRLREWLPKATYPLRMGMHGNSAFGLTLALADARTEARAGRPALEREIVAAAKRWFAGDRDYPASWEPSGSDFLSPALTEATLMREILDAGAFRDWLDAFLPRLAAGEPRALLEPAIVSDASDPQIAHLHGLNLSRAWCMRRIAEALGGGDPRSGVLADAIARHADASLAAAVGSDYMVEHWLAAYAVLLLT